VDFLEAKGSEDIFILHYFQFFHVVEDSFHQNMISFLAEQYFHSFDSSSELEKLIVTDESLSLIFPHHFKN
jgi:hypothetical protein